MKTLILLLSSLLIISACSTTSPSKPNISKPIPSSQKHVIPNAPVVNSKPVKIIGGISAPIYFKDYDQKVINDITEVTTATKIIISYPSSLKPLAIQIQDGIKAKSQTPIQLYEVNLKDTPTVKYRHDVVIVALDFRK